MSGYAVIRHLDLVNARRLLVTNPVPRSGQTFGMFVDPAVIETDGLLKRNQFQWLTWRIGIQSGWAVYRVLGERRYVNS